MREYIGYYIRGQRPLLQAHQLKQRFVNYIAGPGYTRRH
jgi:hypothetical protein